MPAEKRQTSKFTGGFPYFPRILREFEIHESEDTASLQKHRHLVERLKDPGIKALLDWPYADKERHHQGFELILEALRGSVEFRAAKSNPLEPAETHWDHIYLLRENPLTFGSELGIPVSELGRMLPELEGIERKSINACKKLLPHVRYEPPLKALLEAMTLDSEKHLKILKAIRDIARRYSSTSHVRDWQ